jgi:peroxiredoxin
MKLRYLIAFMIAGILIGMSAYHYLTRLGEGDPAPSFSLPDITHEKHTLEEYRGDVVALHFWATWCDVCLVEIPEIEKINRKFKDSDFKVVSILEDEHDAEAKLQAYMVRNKITFPVLFDSMGKVASAYQSYGVPETFFIGRNGVIIKRVTGGIDWNGSEYTAYIESLLKKQ